MDITEVILSDHHEQRRMFALLDDVDRSDVKTLTALWTRLSAVLEVHAEAEETKDAIGDHNDIRDGILEAARHEVGSDGWWGGVDAARHANDEHMGEEEHEGLRDFRLHVDLETRDRIAVPFVAYEAEFVAGVPIEDKDPDQYVEDQGEGDGAR